MAFPIVNITKDRGTFFQDPSTGSTKTKLVKGSDTVGSTNTDGSCACDTYKSYSVSMSFNDLVSCKKKLAGVATISIKLRSDFDGRIDMQTLVNTAQTYLLDQAHPE